MKKKILFIALLVQVLAFGQQQWRPLGQDDFNQICYDETQKISIAVNNDNIPYVAASSFKNEVLSLSVRRFINSKWEDVGPQNFSTSEVSSFVIGIDNFNVPYIVYRTTANTSFVRKLVNNVWQTISISELIRSPKIYFDSENNLYVLANFGSSEHLGLRKYNGTSWSTVGTASISSGYTDHFSFDFDNNGIPYVAYSNFSSAGKLTIKKLDNGTWQNVGDLNQSATDAEYITIKFNSANVPHVAYKNNLSVNPTAYLKKYTGLQQWESVGPNGGLLSTDVGTLTFEMNQDIPVIAVANAGITKVIKLNGTSWETIGQTWLHGREPNILFDSSNTPLVAFQDAIAGVKRFDGIKWEILGSESLSGNSLSEYAVSTITADDTPYIAYHTTGDLDMKVNKWNGSVWENIADETLNVTQSIPFSLTSYNNVPYLLNYNLNTSKVSVKKLATSGWVNAGLTEVINPSNAISYAKLAVDGNGTIYVAAKAFTGNDAYLNFYKSNGTAWALQNFFLQIDNESQLDFAVGSDNRPALVYSETPNQLQVRKLNATGDNWELLGNGITAITAASYVHLAISSQNIPYVSFITYEDPKQVLVYRFVSGSWESVGAPMTFNLLEHPVIYLDKNDVPYLTYYDSDAPGTGQGRISVCRLNGTIWELVGQRGFSASNSVQLSTPYLGFTSANVPIVTYSCKGYYAKFFGEANALNVKEQQMLTHDFVLYPNPAEKTVNISSDLIIDSVRIIDLTGKAVLQSKYDSNMIDVSTLQTGMYLFEIHSKDDKKITKRLLKK